MRAYTHGDRLRLDEAFELLYEMEGVKLNATTYVTYLCGLCRIRPGGICMELSSNAVSERLPL